VRSDKSQFDCLFWVLEVARDLETGCEAYYSYKSERWRAALDVLRSRSDKELKCPLPSSDPEIDLTATLARTLLP